MGFRLAALSAGKNPNTTPMIALTENATRTDWVEISVRNPANFVSNGASQSFAGVGPQSDLGKEQRHVTQT